MLNSYFKAIRLYSSAQDLRPKQHKYKKSFKGTFKSHPTSLKGTYLQNGSFGIVAINGKRLSDTHLDAARIGIRRAFKNEKGSKY